MGVSISKTGRASMCVSVLKQRLIKNGCKSEMSAVRLYDIVSLCLAGEYANINFPKENYSQEVVNRFYKLYLKNYQKI